MKRVHIQPWRSPASGGFTIGQYVELPDGSIGLVERVVADGRVWHEGMPHPWQSSSLRAWLPKTEKKESNGKGGGSGA